MVWPKLTMHSGSLAGAAFWKGVLLNTGYQLKTHTILYYDRKQEEGECLGVRTDKTALEGCLPSLLASKLLPTQQQSTASMQAISLISTSKSLQIMLWASYPWNPNINTSSNYHGKPAQDHVVGKKKVGGILCFLGATSKGNGSL
jgi:hypothetical protein